MELCWDLPACCWRVSRQWLMRRTRSPFRLADLFIGSDPAAAFYSKLLDDWAAAHPDVNLVREETQGDDHRLKLATDLAAGNTADVFYNWVAPGDLNKFVDAGVALDMNEFFKVSTKLHADHWTEAQLATVSVNGEPYALPVVGLKCFMLYNTELFSANHLKPPTNWDELVAVSKAFNDVGIVPIDTGSKGGNPGHFLYNVVLAQMAGGQEAAEASYTTYNVSAPPMRAAAHVINDMIKDKMFPADTVANGDWGPSVALYNQGKAAMLYTCPWMLPDIEKAGMADKTELMYFPTLEGAAVEGSSFNIGNINNGWMINKASFEDPKKQAIIVDLVETLQSDAFEKFLVQIGDFPGWKVKDMSVYSLSPLAKKMFEFTAKSPGIYTGFYSLVPTQGALTALLEAMDRLFAGDDPDAVFDAFQSTVDRDKP
jgi:ABC-type glycerol-3-phosphate transport system substrate-binding protein